MDDVFYPCRKPAPLNRLVQFEKERKVGAGEGPEASHRPLLQKASAC